MLHTGQEWHEGDFVLCVKASGRGWWKIPYQWSATRMLSACHQVLIVTFPPKSEKHWARKKFTHVLMKSGVQFLFHHSGVQLLKSLHSCGRQASGSAEMWHLAVFSLALPYQKAAVCLWTSVTSVTSPETFLLELLLKCEKAVSE